MVIGKNVTVYKGVYSVAPEKELEGMPAKVLGIDDDGGLEVIYTDRKRETLTSGENFCADFNSFLAGKVAFVTTTQYH